MTDDVYQVELDPDAHWSTTNVSEAIPGVQTPLSWTLWRPVHERGVRGGFAAIGALERDRVVPGHPHDWLTGFFHGRIAAKVEFLGEVGDRIPGTSGAEIARQFLGRVPEGFRSEPTKRRWPVIAAKLPIATITTPRAAGRLAAQTAVRWTAEIARVGDRSLPQARARFTDAAAWFEQVFTAHCRLTLAAVQPTYGQVLALAGPEHVDLAGRVLAGQGSHTELAMVEDLWALSRDRLTLADFLAHHGFHGPMEGELSSRPWREEPAAVHELAARYRAAPGSDSPVEQQRKLEVTSAAARAELLDLQPRLRRPAARLVLAAADRYIGLRGLGKAAFIQAFDSCRALARRIGVLLADAGVLADPEDVFYLTTDEMLAAEPLPDLRDRVEARRVRRGECAAVVLPGAWRGRPEVVVQEPVPDEGAGLRLEGIGTSPGVVEGVIRVVTDPTFADVEPGEILVAPVTDPAWAPIMFVSAALVVEIGGLFSHAAVVARELGIPCVMGIGDATTRLRTGDRCRVDGGTGVVEVLERG